MTRTFVIIAAFVLALIGLQPAPALACDGYTSGYTRSNGTYVSGYYHSCADSTVTNNYTYYNNTNPYTSERGTDRYYSSPSSEWYTPSRTRSSSSYSSYWP